VIVYRRPVRFEDVDAAGLLFFGRYMNYILEAMERLFVGPPFDENGGLIGLIKARKIGFPTVHVTCDYQAPLEYGDVAEITAEVAKLGRASCTFKYAVRRASDQGAVASITHTVVCMNFATKAATPVPDDVRVVLAAHLSTAS
jgi:4-hydroxybenzoyl-CoA thioesterase